jgi:ABC-type glycerol-3-phosphate transport system substrate-binding protein
MKKSICLFMVFVTSLLFACSGSEQTQGDNKIDSTNSTPGTSSSAEKAPVEMQPQSTAIPTDSTPEEVEVKVVEETEVETP